MKLAMILLATNEQTKGGHHLRKVHKKMSDERIAKRIKIKPFVKYVNFNHFMPTRYLVSSHLDVK